MDRHVAAAARRTDRDAVAGDQEHCLPDDECMLIGDSAIDCVAGVGCVAIGSYPLSDNHDRALIETRGVTGGWAASTILDAPAGDSVNLDQVACNVERCVAGGEAAQPFPQLPLLYERDDTIAGAPWVKAIGVGPVAAGTGGIRRVACPAHGDCVALGLVVADPNTQVNRLVAVDLIGGQLQPTQIVELPAGIGLKYLEPPAHRRVPPGVCVGTSGYDWGGPAAIPVCPPTPPTSSLWLAAPP